MADENKTKEEVKEISPAEYFEMVKSRMQEETEENIRLLYNTTMTKLRKYMVTGQVKAAKELYSRCVYLEKEILYKINKNIHREYKFINGVTTRLKEYEE